MRVYVPEEEVIDDDDCRRREEAESCLCKPTYVSIGLPAYLYA